MNSILLLEDEESVNRGITFSLKKQGYAVHSCTTIKEAMNIFEEYRPVLIICDITLPDGSGLDFVRRIRKISQVHIIFLTALDQEVDQVMGYEAGGDDYITKPFSLSVLTLKIEAFFNKIENKKNNNIVLTGILEFDILAMKVYKDGEEILLTKNEWKLLKLFTQNAKQVLTKQVMLENIFDIDGDFVDENTIAVNIRRLRKKIEPDVNNPEYIKNIRGIGYVWDKEVIKK